MAYADYDEHEHTDWQDTELHLFERRHDEIGFWINEVKVRTETSQPQAWKVTEHKIVHWPLAAKGTFLSDEVYIVLNRNDPQTTTIPERRINTPPDIYCWVGKSACPDLYRKGFYNATALDEALGGDPLLHRESQDCESKRFINIFKYFTVLKGRSDGMDRCDLRSTYKERLLRVTGPIAGTLCIRETALKRGAMRESNDVFIVDTGLKIYVWIGSGLSNSSSKVTKAREYATGLKEERKSRGITLLTVYEDETNKTNCLYDVFPPQAKKPIEAKKRKPPLRIHREGGPGVHLMVRRKMFEVVPMNPARSVDHDFHFRKVCEGEDVCLRRMESSKVYVVLVRDNEDHVFVRLGDCAWAGEKGNGLIIAHDCLKKLLREEELHPGVAITAVREGQYSLQLSAAVGI